LPAGASFFLVRADWHDAGSPPSWRRPASPEIRYGALRARNGFKLLVIGTELGGLITGPTHKTDFLSLIQTTRAQFVGKLTYAATAGEFPERYYIPSERHRVWYREYDELHWVSSWSALDYVGIDAYPNLTANDGSSEAGLLARHDICTEPFGWSTPSL
jgi:hypothetical protein